MSDEVTIDVGPVFCPSCKRPYVSAPTLTEEERRLRGRLHQRTMDGYEDGYAEVYVVTDDLHDALAIIDRLSASTRPAPEGLSEEERRPANPYLRFTEQASPSGKTRTVDIHSERSGDALGRIAWYGPWRQYTFYPAGCSIWNTGCLDTVQGYIAALMEDRRG